MLTMVNQASDPSLQEYEEKKSVFIGAAAHCDSLDQAADFLESMRQAHPKARHHAFAAVAGSSPSYLSERMSDDGEPAGTAGRPILNLLRHREISQTVVAVSRYFGGILLGTGGLTRAYSAAASLALEAGRLAEIVPAVDYSLTLAYRDYQPLINLVKTCRGEVRSESFTDKVSLTVVVPDPPDGQSSFIQLCNSAFPHTVLPRRLGDSSLTVPLKQ